MSVATQHSPSVHTYEDHDELVIEIEVPAGCEPKLVLSVGEGVLTVRVPRPKHRSVEYDLWSFHPDATP